MDLKELAQQNKNKKQLRHPWEQARVAFLIKKLREQLDMNAKSIFLDIGCGDTYVAEKLIEKIPNCSIYCVDTAFTDDQLLYYSNKYRNCEIKVFNDLTKAILQIEDEISFVLMLDVIEHIKYDLEFLIRIKQIKHFNSNTIMFITVPAFQCLTSNHDKLLGHYRRYTNKSLEEVTNNSGFETIKKGYFFSILLAPRFIWKVKEIFVKPNTKSTSISKWNKGLVVTNLYKNILILDFSITSLLEKINIKPRGLSNYILCKKPVL